MDAVRVELLFPEYLIVCTQVRICEVRRAACPPADTQGSAAVQIVSPGLDATPGRALRSPQAGKHFRLGWAGDDPVLDVG